jgi:hypothetical protein
MGSNPTRQRLRVDRGVRKCSTFKIGFATRDEALDAAERQMEAGRVSPGCHLMPYLCDRGCGEWHIRNQRIVFLAPEDTSKHDYRRKG